MGDARHIAAGVDGGLFFIWPETAEFLRALALKRGEPLDTTAPPKPQRAGS